MAESDPSDTRDPGDNPLERQPCQNLGLEQLDTVRALSREGANVQLHLHQHTVQNSKIVYREVKGDIVQGLKTDVKDSGIGTLILPTGDSSPQGHSQPQALPEPLIQAALSWEDGEKQEIESDQMMENREKTPKTISSTRMPMPVKRDHGLQTIVPVTYEEESQTDEIGFREKMSQTNEKLRFDTEAQTDNPRTRNRELQTDLYVMDSDSQTFSMISQRSNSYAQTVNNVFSDTDSQTEILEQSINQTQTEILEQSTNQTQTEMKSYQENEFQTDKVETLEVNSQTNEQSLLDIHPAIMDGLAVASSDDKSALEMIKLYKNEKTKQDVGDFLPLLETTWKFIQYKIILKSIETQLLHGLVPESKIQLACPIEQNLSTSTFISRVHDVYKVGEEFASENNFIHAVISFYAAAKLHRISNKCNSSVFGIRQCSYEVCSVVKKMTQQPGTKNIVIDHVIPLMHEMKDYIQSIEGSSRDIKVEYEARCLCNIGKCYSYCGEYQQLANINESAIDLMKKQFNDKAVEYCVYGHCLNNAGIAYGKLGEIEKSIEKLKMSLKAYEEANDWSYDEHQPDDSLKNASKEYSTAKSRNNLKEMEAELRK